MREPKKHNAALMHAVKLAGLPEGDPKRDRALDWYSTLASKEPPLGMRWRDIAIAGLRKTKHSRDARTRRDRLSRRLRSGMLLLVLWRLLIAVVGIHLSRDQNLVIGALVGVLLGAWIYVNKTGMRRFAMFNPESEQTALNEAEEHILWEIGERGDLASPPIYGN